MFVFEVLLPLIFIVAVGFLTTKKGFFSQQFVAEVSKFVLYVSLPAVIISSLSSIELGQVIQVNFMLVYAIAGLSAMTVAILVSKGCSSPLGRKASLMVWAAVCQTVRSLAFQWCYRCTTVSSLKHF